jgi:hypothetical protein
MFNAMDHFVARKALEQVARDQFSHETQDAQPEQGRTNPLTWFRRYIPRSHIRHIGLSNSQVQLPAHSTAKAVKPSSG